MRPVFEISTDRDRLDVEVVHRFLSEEAYWCRGVPLATVEKAIAGSMNFGVYSEGRQIGFARVISDQATIAYLGDVFILPGYRGYGLGKTLMQSIMSHPDLQGLRRWILLTGDAHGLYRQFGWKDIAQPDKWMEWHNRDVYAKKERSQKLPV